MIIKGFLVLDTCGDGEKLIEALKKVGLRLEILEIRKIGTNNVLCAVKDAMASD